FTPEGKQVAVYNAPSGYYMDEHELLITGDGLTKRAHYLTYSISNLDLTSVGGGSNVPTAAHQLVRSDESGAVYFQWYAWNRIGIDEWVNDATQKARSSTDYD